MHRFSSIVLYFIINLFLVQSIVIAKNENYVNGLVQHQITNQPIVGVNVIILNTTVGAMTDANGKFSISDIDTGTYVIRATMMGFEAIEKTMIVSGEGTLNLFFQMKPTVLNINKEIVITANRNETNTFDITNSMSILNNDELRKKIPRSTPEALMETAGVWMQKTNHGGGSPFIRGLVGNQVLVLVDGIRLNNATFRYGPNQYLNTVDSWQIEKIEVLRGSGSIQYGSDALGGVVNIISKQPRFSNEGIRCSGNLLSRYMSSDMEKSGRMELEIASPRVALLGGFSIKNFGDIKAGGNLDIESPSGYDEIDGDFKAAIRLSTKQMMTFAIQNVVQTDVPRFDQVAQRGYKYYSFDPQIRRLAYAKYQLFSESKWRRSLNLILSWQSSIEQRKKQKNESQIRILEKDDVSVFGFSLELKFDPLPNWTILSGIDYFSDEVNSWRKDENLETNTTNSRRGLYPNGATAKSFAVFVDNSILLERLAINIGGRINRYSISAPDETFENLEVEPSAFIGNVALMYAINPYHKLIASFSQGFRAPNINDVSSLGEFDYGIEVPNIDLSPEKTINFEFGIKSRMENLSSALVVYRTNLFNLIDRIRSNYNGSEFYEGQQVYKKKNVSEAFIHGVESELEYQLMDHVAVFGNVVYTYGQKSNPNEPMRRIPPFHGQIGVRMKYQNKIWGEARLQFVAKQDRLAAADIDDHRIPEGGTPGWSVFNLSAGYSLSSNFDLMVGLHNLFDEAYRYHGSGVDGYGRSFWIGLNAKL